MTSIITRNAIGRGDQILQSIFPVASIYESAVAPKRSWDEIFAEAGYEIVIDEVTSPKVDPTGLGICYVLKPDIA